VRDENAALDAKLKLHVDDEHRVVVVGTPGGLDAMTDAEIVALSRRAAQVAAGYKAAGYAVTWDSEHSRWLVPDAHVA
jgi:hypothetical protein